MSGIIDMPADCFIDSRLTPRDIKLLAAISYYSCPLSGICSESREKLASRAGFSSHSRVSTSLTNLRNCGWVEQIDVTRPPQLKVVDLDISSPKGNVTEITKSPNGNVSTQGSDTGTLSGQQGSDTGTLSGQQGSDTGTLSQQSPQSGTLAYSIYINIYNITDTDSVSDSDVVEVSLIEVMLKHGVPTAMINQSDADLISKWADDGYSTQNLQSACTKAKNNNPQYFGPRYIDRVLRSMYSGDSEVIQQQDDLGGGCGFQNVIR